MSKARKVWAQLVSPSGVLRWRRVSLPATGLEAASGEAAKLGNLERRLAELERRLPPKAGRQ